MSVAPLHEEEEDVFPQSVEEAAALLGAAITRCGSRSHKTIPPPKGMHSSFSIVDPVPSVELFVRLHSFRALLRSSSATQTTTAASLLPVLMKLLGVSSSLATVVDNNKQQRVATPPMMSTPLRKLWVDCIVLCHVLGKSQTSGPQRIDTFAFVRNMMALAGMNPRTAKAAGGTRIAALDVIGGLFSQEAFSNSLAPWALEVWQLCHRALRSIGTGEPTYRVAAMRLACCVTRACRQASLINKRQQQRQVSPLLLKGALEQRALAEALKLLKYAAQDKFPEVRYAAATLASMLAPLVFCHESSSSDGPITAALDDLMGLAMKNLDDEAPQVASEWAAALARCCATAIEYGQQTKAATGRRKPPTDDDEGTAQKQPQTTTSSTGTAVETLGGFGSRNKVPGMAQVCSSLKGALSFLVDQFVKVGGELAASRAGGFYSQGGRAVRLGMAVAMVELLRLVQASGGSGLTEETMSRKNVIHTLLNMVGPELEKQLLQPNQDSECLDATSFVAQPSVATTTTLFGTASRKSHADAGLARLAASRVLRRGLSEVASEPTQFAILRELIAILSDDNKGPHQIQVVLIEISHLFATLGDACTSCLEDVCPILKKYLQHANHGVRHEAAVACAAMVTCDSALGRTLLQSTVSDCQLQYGEIVKLANTKGVTDDSGARRKMFGRLTPSKKEAPVDTSRKHQYAIHGYTLMVSMLLRDLPALPGGLPTDLLALVLSLAEVLVSCQFNESIARKSPSAACTCIRAGFGIVCGALTAGPAAIAEHMPLIMGMWRNSAKAAQTGTKHFTPAHDLICLDAVLSSLVVFLQYCAELLLTVPDALSQTSLLLEELLMLLLPAGRLGSTPENPAAVARLQSAKASIMEAFAWLPSGSFPMAADAVFSFAADHIQSAIVGEVTCSILPHFVNKEDGILDAKSLCRARRVGQVGGARDLEENIVTLTSEAAHHGDRESVLYFLEAEDHQVWDDSEFHGSRVLGLFASEGKPYQPPTPLHEVGTWRKPVEPSCSSQVRLIDAAIQVFSATFGLKSGLEQQAAMDMLESLVPPLLTQLARSIGMNTALIEQDRRTKSKEDNAAVANITAVLLSCLQALPLHEASQHGPVGLGPPWMNKAKDLLLTLLPSASNVVRRAAAQGLALLATLGVTEDAHFLQSTVLHSLDEVMQGNQPDGKPRQLPLEPISAARAGSLLTLACIQRTAKEIKDKQESVKSRARIPMTEDVTLQQESDLPTLQMMTRIIPSTACLGLGDYFIVRTYALHSFGILLAYSTRWAKDSLDPEDFHLLRKAIELVEDNFLAAWTAASLDLDRGQEAEKLAAEASFLAVLLRLMTFLVPYLNLFRESNPGVARRFSCMATLIMECHGHHPAVAMEGMALFEILGANRGMLPGPSTRVLYSENAVLMAIPFILDFISTDHAVLLAEEKWRRSRCCSLSSLGLKVTLRTATLLTLSQLCIGEWTDMKIVSLLFALLETISGSRNFIGGTVHRSLAAPRETESIALKGHGVELEIIKSAHALLFHERTTPDKESPRLLRWILLARALLVGSLPSVEDDSFDTRVFTRANVVQNATLQAKSDATPVFESASPVGWHVKTHAAWVATSALEKLRVLYQKNQSLASSTDFSFELAAKVCSEECQEAQSKGNEMPASRVIFHLSELLSAAFSSSIATLDQSELELLQCGAMKLVTELISCFGSIPDPQQPNEKILTQYATQLVSTIRHALGVSEERNGATACRLFLLGCEALYTAVKTELITEPAVLKRMVRFVIPSEQEIPFFEFHHGPPDDVLRLNETATDESPGEKKVHENRRSALVTRICKMWTMAKLSELSNHGSLTGSCEAISQELEANMPSVAVHSAALTVDGVRLLLGSGLGLCGITSRKENVLETDLVSKNSISIDSGYFYRNIQDIDDSAKSALVRMWSACCCNAIRCLVKTVSSEVYEEHRDACSKWLEKLVPIVFKGVADSLFTLTVTGQPTTKNAHGWAKGIDSSEVAFDCIYSLGLLVQSGTLSKGHDDLEQVITKISRSILLPSMKLTATAGKSEVPSKVPPNVIESCKLLELLAESESLSGGSALLIALLTPLNMLQEGVVQLDNDISCTVLRSCLASATSLISYSRVEDNFVKAMLKLSMEVLPRKDAGSLKHTTSVLLRECLTHGAIRRRQQQEVLASLAQMGSWEAWRVVCSVEDGAVATRSFSTLHELLSDVGNPDRQLAALDAVRDVLQGASNALTGRILHGVGADVLCVLVTYGSTESPHRTKACSDAMKIILVAYQQLTQEELPAFLTVLFGACIAVLRYNGLPNHPAPQSGSDPALGRMAAQAILHVARTQPAAFKEVLGVMPELDRTIVEVAVRGEMTGYATGQAQPQKKKLNLKGFKK